MLVRAAVLKGKDPSEIFLELEKIDLMEYNPDQPPPLNDKVLKEKRKKLKETLERVYKLYEKEDPEFFARMKKMEGDYEKRRTQIISYRDAVRTAQQVHIMDIPLPTPGAEVVQHDATHVYHPAGTHFGGYQVPHAFYPSYAPIPIPAAPSQGILKKTSSYASEALKAKKPPGVPMGPPPTLQDIWMDEEEMPEPHTSAEEITEALKPSEDHDKSGDEDEPPIKKHTSLQEKMLQLAGQDIDVFMRDVEDAQKKKDRDRREDKDDNQDRGQGSVAQSARVAPTMQLRPPGPPPGLPPPLMARPLMARPGLQPPPPPLRMPMRMAGLPMPPGPPPGLPMRMMRPLMPPGFIPPEMPNIVPAIGQTMPHNVLTAAPRIVKRQREQTEQSTASATIEGKPQIRSLAAEVTRFVPVQLRHKKEQPKSVRESVAPAPKPEVVQPKQAPVQQPTKEDAYHQFMKEMTGLL